VFPLEFLKIQEEVEKFLARSPSKGVNPDEVWLSVLAIQGGDDSEVKDVLSLDCDSLISESKQWAVYHQAYRI